MIEFIVDDDCRQTDFDLAWVSLMTIRSGHTIEASESVEFDDVAINFVSRSRICQLHEQFLADGSETDIITFPAERAAESSRISGDIAICLEVAGEQAAEVPHSLESELVFLAIHGMLHLCGWDDQSDADRDRMLDRQRDLMDDAISAGGRRV